MNHARAAYYRGWRESLRDPTSADTQDAFNAGYEAGRRMMAPEGSLTYLVEEVPIQVLEDSLLLRTKITPIPGEEVIGLDREVSFDRLRVLRYSAPRTLVGTRQEMLRELSEALAERRTRACTKALRLYNISPRPDDNY